VIDPLLSAEPAKEALDLYYANRGKKPVVGGVFSPTHLYTKCGRRGGVAEYYLKKLKIKKKTPPCFNKKTLYKKKITPKTKKTPPTNIFLIKKKKQTTTQ
ncbi:hypothetical protein ACVGW1_17795, partial [Enterobacter intestinihominis]